MNDIGQSFYHLCHTCSKEFATCDAERIVFAIDRNPSLRGELADVVVECDQHRTKVAEAQKAFEAVK